MGRLRRLVKRVLHRGSEQRTHSVSPSYTPPSPTEYQEEESESSVDLANIECDVQELFERMETGEELTIVDVREPHELRSSGTIPTAIHIPLREISTRWEELKDANEIICYCHSGVRSYDAAMFLRQQDLFNATSLTGGIVDWKASNFPTEKWSNES